MTTSTPPRSAPRLERVFITGAGIVSSIGNGYDAFAQAVHDGRCGAMPAEEAFGDALKGSGLQVYKVRDFDASADIDPALLGTMDPIAQFTVAAARQALRQAGLDTAAVDPERAGIVFGTAGGGADNRMRYGTALATGAPADPALLHDFTFHAPATRVMDALGWEGPVVALSSACASASLAIGHGYEALRRGEADAMLCGGADYLGTISLAILNTTRLLSKGPMRPFDRRRTGFAVGEGAAMLCLESESALRRRGGTALCEILGWGVSAQAHSARASEPTGRWLALAMTRALERAGLPPAAIEYVNLHGNATDQDLSEVRAMRKVFGDDARRIPASATKAMYGYMTGANGAVDAMAVIAGMRGGFLPPTIHLEEPDPRCDIDCVPNAARPHEFTTALSLNAGVGGTCSALVLRACDGPGERAPASPVHP
jgi:3-oxoacyl-[acyl-carrier-protein] synthase II